MAFEQVFVKKGTNTAEVTAGSIAVIQHIEEAEKNGYLPHGVLTLANQGTVTLYIFLDDMSNQDTPDYVLFPSQQLTINPEEGVNFRTIFILNTDGATSLAVNQLKYRLATAYEV